MKTWAITIPGVGLLGWITLLSWPVAWPFYVAAAAIPPVALSAVSSWLLCCNLYRRWRLPEIGEKTDVRYPVQSVQIVSQSVFGYDTPAPKADYTRDYRQSACVFAHLGNSKGFQVSGLVPVYVSRGQWDLYTDLMVAMGALVKKPYTQWMPGYGNGNPLRHFVSVVRHEAVPFPIPHPSTKPERVEWLNSPHARTSRTARTPRMRIIEGKAM